MSEIVGVGTALVPAVRSLFTDNDKGAKKCKRTTLTRGIRQGRQKRNVQPSTPVTLTSFKETAIVMLSSPKALASSFILLDPNIHQPPGSPAVTGGRGSDLTSLLSV